MKSISRSTPPVLRRDLRMALRLAATGLAARVNWPSWLTIGLNALVAGMPACAAMPRLRIAGRDAVENGPSCSMSWLMAGACACRSWSSGTISSDSPLTRARVGRSCVRNGGRSWRLARSAALRSAVAWLTVLALTTKSATCWRWAASGARTMSELTREVGEHLVLVGEDAQDLVGLLQRRVRAVDGLRERLAVAGQAGAELVDDQRQALLLGCAQDVLIWSMPTGLDVFLTGR